MENYNFGSLYKLYRYNETTIYKITSYIKENGIKTYTLEKSDTDIENGKFRPGMQSSSHRLIKHCLNTILLYKTNCK